MSLYSVKKLSDLAGVSVRTLHLYDRMGLLKPTVRTEARYRMYGEKDLLRLQQILFYKELDFPLREILGILNNPDFDLVSALESHKTALQQRQTRISRLLGTIDKTIVKLKEGKMLNHEELYAGLSREQADAFRLEAAEKWGEETVSRSEKAINAMSRQEIAGLVEESKTISARLAELASQHPASDIVQEQIARHYQSIRRFWGTSHSADKQAEAYAGLGQLYVDDERYMSVDGQPQPAFAHFMRDAMTYFADNKLK